jgi:glycosyltransferase involved in cell wall biosynthesis
MKVSIIIPSFKRFHLLRWNLFSLAKQTIPFEFETIVLNDGELDETEGLCELYKEKLNLRCIFTGQRNVFDRLVWRIPGYAINIGVKQSSGDIILLCCAEMYHINDTVKLISNAYDAPNSDKVLAIPRAKDDNGRFLGHVEALKGDCVIDEFDSQPKLDNVKFPFLLALTRKEFVNIGGYDEDFIGTDFDDTDFVERLVADGCKYVVTEAKTVHLWHSRLPMTPERKIRYDYNKKLYTERKNIILRNVGREWGVL